MFTTIKKTVFLIIYLTRDNFSTKKPRFSSYYSERKNITNWLSVYLVYSSLFLDLLDVLIRKLKLSVCTKMSFSIKYIDNITLFYPLMTRYDGVFEREFEKYSEDFEKRYNEKFNFSEGDVVIDIGAYVGAFSIPIVKKNNVQVFAYEPDPGNFYCIQKGIKRNGISSDNFMVEPYAVFSTNGKAEFSLGDTPATGSISSIDFILDNKKNRKVQVETVTLKSIFECNSIKKCKLLKVNCEGSEYAIFNELDSDIFDRIEHLWIEVHPVPGFSAEEFIRKLSDRFEVKFQKIPTLRETLPAMYEVFCKNHNLKKKIASVADYSAQEVSTI